MSLRQKFETLIKKKETEIVEYESKIKEAKAYIQGLQDSLKFLPRYENSASIGGDAVGKIKQGSNPYKVYELLKERKQPMHIKDIMEGIGLPYDKNTRSTLRSALGWYVNKGRIFKLVDAGTFGLIEWDEKKLPEEDESVPF